MKKSQSTAAVLLIAILAFDFLLPTTPVAAAGQAPTGQAVTPTAE